MTLPEKINAQIRDIADFPKPRVAHAAAAPCQPSWSAIGGVGAGAPDDFDTT